MVLTWQYLTMRLRFSAETNARQGRIFSFPFTITVRSRETREGNFGRKWRLKRIALLLLFLTYVFGSKCETEKSIIAGFKFINIDLDLIFRLTFEGLMLNEEYSMDFVHGPTGNPRILRFPARSNLIAQQFSDP